MRLPAPPVPAWLRGWLVRQEATPFCRAYTKAQPATTISGHLIARSRTDLVLRHAAVHWDGQVGGERPIAGDVHIPLSNVDFYTLT